MSVCMVIKTRTIYFLMFKSLNNPSTTQLILFSHNKGVNHTKQLKLQLIMPGVDLSSLTPHHAVFIHSRSLEEITHHHHPAASRPRPIPAELIMNNSKWGKTRRLLLIFSYSFCIAHIKNKKSKFLHNLESGKRKFKLTTS